MSFEVRDNRDESRYEVLVDGALAGVAQYRLCGGRITMVHTEIDPAREGGGLGRDLAQGALEDVRSRALGLEPLCPFIACYIRRHPDQYLDLVIPTMRGKVMDGGGED